MYYKKILKLLFISKIFLFYFLNVVTIYSQTIGENDLNSEEIYIETYPKLNYFFTAGIGIPYGNFNAYTEKTESYNTNLISSWVIDLTNTLAFKQVHLFTANIRSINAKNLSLNQKSLLQANAKYSLSDNSINFGYDHLFLKKNYILGWSVGYNYFIYELNQDNYNVRNANFTGYNLDLHFKKLWWLAKNWSLGINLFYQKDFLKGSKYIDIINTEKYSNNFSNTAQADYLGILFLINFNLYTNKAYYKSFKNE